MRSARSASRVVVEEVEAEEDWWACRPWANGWPWWPSLMAVVDSADNEVVPELGVPLMVVSSFQFPSQSTDQSFKLTATERRGGLTGPCLRE